MVLAYQPTINLLYSLSAAYINELELLLHTLSSSRLPSPWVDWKEQSLALSDILLLSTLIYWIQAENGTTM